ncbi:MAG: hypothetical protein HYY25_12265 [Candidatus Wallbacteria bacterium]|nr:hypothetical protein [Candidatus Wallbacteria bacterium]
MAGTAMRHLEMARALAKEHEVLLAVAGQPDAGAASGVQLTSLDDPDLEGAARRSGTVLVQGYAFRKLPWLRQLTVPIVGDLYDPAPLANLEIGAANAAANGRQERHELCLGFAIELLLHADFFLAAHERARDFWLGMLAALGRVDPRGHALGPSFRRLIDTLPTGVPSAAPPKGAEAPEHPAYANGRRPFIWSGGIWDWMDAGTLLKAFAQVAAARPDAALVFLGTRHPNPEVPPMGAAARARELAAGLGLLECQVYFEEWTPLAERHAWLAHATAGVSLHGAHLEARFAWRTRLLDHLWVGLPSVVSLGDALGDEMVAAQAALGVPPGDVAAVRIALLALLDEDELRRRQSAAARTLADRYTWPDLVAPLARFLAAPYTTQDRGAPLRYVDYLKEFLPHSPFHSARLARARKVLATEGSRGLARRALSRAARAVGLSASARHPRED